ncbi:MAG: P-type conjugative transfer protein TrbL, partial [Thiobacillus sp.]|nr:P-type conjugative transfer protein TrbL [Thiobacillus sp.]
MKRLLPFLGLALLFVSFGAHAQLSNDGLLTDIATRYQSAASAWATYIMGRATWLYWTLVTISLVWTGGMMLLRGAGLQEFFSEFVRFIMTTGFFWWLLMMAPTFVPGIYQSMSMIGASASGLGSDLRPSGIVDIGFAVLNATLDNSSFMEPIDSLIGFLMAMVILIVLALIAVNMVVLLISGWVVGYAGIIYLGFGGSRWTSEMAISFYKTVLAIGIQLMAMILLVGIGKTFMDDYYARMAAGSVELKEMAVLMVASLVLLVLVNKVPQLISSIASSNVGMSGLGSYGSGTALAAAGVAGAAVGVGASMIAAGAANIAGGASAIKAAFSQGGSNVASGTDVMAKMAGGAGGGAAGGGSDAGGGGGGGGAGTASSTPFAQAAGLDSQGGGASVTSIAGRSSSGGDSGGGSGSGG